MMKKLAVMVFMIAFTALGVNAAEQTKCPAVGKMPPSHQEMAKRKAQKEAAFEKKLGLTEEQKAQAKVIRQNGHEKLKPVMDDLRAKRQEEKTVKFSRIAIPDQEAKLKKIDEEIKALEKEANSIRKSNMKEFESILTKEQKKTLKEMKKEGRDNFKKNHPPVYGRPVQKPVTK